MSNHCRPAALLSNSPPKNVEWKKSESISPTQRLLINFEGRKFVEQIAEVVVFIAFAGKLGRFLNRMVRNQSNRETMAWEKKSTPLFSFIGLNFLQVNKSSRTGSLESICSLVWLNLAALQCWNPKPAAEEMRFKNGILGIKSAFQKLYFTVCVL